MAKAKAAADKQPHPLFVAIAAFLVVAGGIYLTGILAVALLRHVFLPIFALLAGFWVARGVYRAADKH